MNILDFSEAELEIFIDGVERNRLVLFSKLSNTTTNATKSKIWETICSKVNSANSKGYKRSTQKSEVWSESACGSSVVSSARVSVPPPISSIGVFPNIPTTLSCGAVSCSGEPKLNSRYLSMV
jgi:hypothetical protein